MNELELPALRGDEPLGFLAGLGVLQLAVVVLQLDAQLAWTDEASPGARLRTAEELSVHDLGDKLRAVADELHAGGGVLPAGPVSFPLRKHGTAGADPMNLSAPALHQQAALAQALELEGDPALSRWLVPLVNPMATSTKGTQAVTPFHAPSGQMTMYSVFQSALSEVVRKPDELVCALTSARRQAGVTGANLDWRALRDAADMPSGTAENAGLPGATWLALMALPLFRLTGTGRRGAATLWQHRRRRSPAMVWPTWREFLDPQAVKTMLEHPLLELGVTPRGTAEEAGDVKTMLEHPLLELGQDGRLAYGAAARDKLPAIGVTQVFLAERRGLSNSAGPLGSGHRIWP